MGIAIPQVVTEDRASGALVIDGSLRFDDGRNTRLKRTVSDGNRRTFTFSSWIKRTMIDATPVNIFAAGSNNFRIALGTGDGYFQVYNYTGSSYNLQKGSTSLYRDISAWYHLVVAIDTTANGAEGNDKVRMYVNGERLTDFGNGNSIPSDDLETYVNHSANTHYLGYIGASGYDLDAYMSQTYFIDGQALGPRFFGYTDPLTGTWRPKKMREGDVSLNDGTVWSSNSSNFSNPGQGFNGNATNYAEVSSSAAKGTFTFPKSIQVDNNVTFVYSSGTAGNLFVNDSSTAMQGTGVQVQTIPFSGILTDISLQSASQPVLWYVSVDGEILTDSAVSAAFGTNGFYLPMDGNSPIGQDRSGKGNDWTPVNFGGSAALDKATGGKPILSTVDGGTVASSGVFGSKAGKTYTVTAAGGKFYLDGSVNPALTSLVKGATYKFDTSDSSNNTHPFIFGTTAEGANYTDGVARSHNDGTTWGSSFVSSSGNFGVGNANTCFDGDITTRNGIDNSSGNGTLTLTVDFKDVHKVEVRTGIQNTLSINGGSVVGTASADPEWITYEPGTAFDLTTITIACAQAGSGGYRVDCYGIKVDNVLLVNNLSDRYTKITVPHNVPNTFYYHCGVHSGMGNSISGSILDETKADPYAWKNVLAMPLVSNGADSSGQINCTTSTKAITTGGSPAVDKISNFYGSAIDFTASSSTGYYPTGAQSDFTFGTNDFTIEFWFKPTTTSRQYMTDFRNNGSGSGSGNNKPFVIFADNGSDGTGTRIRYANDTSSPNMDLLGGVGLPPSNTWHHLAIVRSSGTVYGYLNGVLYNSATDNTNYSTNDSVTIGNSSGVSLNFDGSIQDYRIYNGVAKYTSNFIPASTNPDILLDSPSGVATKSKLTKITDGAVSFDGSGDYLSGFGGSAILPTSTGTAFVVDCFWSSSGNSSQKGIWEQHSGGSGRTAYFVNNGTASFISEGNTVGSFTYVDNKWYFTRIIYDGSGNIYHYVDGVLIGSGTQSNGIDNTGFQIGAYSTDCFNGHISNFRIVVGSNSLSGTDVPTSPLTSITNTALLCCQSNTSATAAAATPGSITANGNAAATNFNPFNTDIKTVRGQEGGYATLSPLNPHNSNNTLTEGNLKFTSSGNDATLTESTIAMSSGKFYFEVVYSGSQGVGQLAGVRKPGAKNYNDSYIYTGEGKKYTDGGSGASYGAGLVNGDVIGTAYDADNGTLEFFKNGVSQGVAFTGITGPRTFLVGSFTSTPIGVANFGQKPFKFPPPDGFQPLMSSTARPDTVVPRPDQYFSTTLYTGNGATSPGGSGGTQSIDVGFEPDMIWIKDLTQSHNHNVLDTVRGPNSIILPDDPRNAVTNSPDAVTAFTSDGFTLGDNGEGTQSLELNKGNNNYVVWSWRAGGSQYTYNKDYAGGSSASDIGVSATSLTLAGATINTKSKFGIYKYNGSGSGGATLTHALEGTPTFIMYKNLDAGAGSSWQVYHKELGGTAYINLDEPDGQTTSDSTRWGGTNPTSTTITLGTHGNGSENFMMYAWCDVPGMFATGKYVNNASADGPFIELGFKPAMVILKCTGGSTNWRLADNTRDPYNNGSSTKWLKPSTTDTEANERAVDFVSNGIKIRSTAGGDINQSSNAGNITYIYAAWAEQPAFNLYGAQSNAR